MFWWYGGNDGRGGADQFDFDPAIARYIITGDSITALDDCTGFLYWGTGLSGGSIQMPPYMHQGVSGTEINEGVDPETLPDDMLYATRLQLLEDCAQDGDVVAIAVGTNSIINQTAAVTIDGLSQVYAAVLDKGAFIEAYTILPSATNIADSRTEEVNDWIRALEVSGLSYGGTTYPATRFVVIDGYTAWGGTYVGHTDSGNLHPNTLGAYKIGVARRTKLKSIGRAYHKLYGTTNPSGNLLTNWALSGSSGTLTGTGNTLTNNGVPTGIAVTVTANAGLTVTAETVASHSPTDSMYAGVVAFPVLKLMVSGTASLQADIAITMTQTVTSVAAGTPFDTFCYVKWKGEGATADPTGLFAFGWGYGSVCKWASNNSSTATNYSNITVGDEAVLRGRMTPPVQAFGSSSVIHTTRIRSGDTASFEIYFGQPFAGPSERTAYAIPKSLNTDQASIGGVRVTGPRVGTSNTSWTATEGVTVTGRPGLAWFGGNLTFQFTWQRDRGGVVTDVAGPTTVTTTASTTQYTVTGLSGDLFRLKVTATNSFGSADAYSVWSSALA